MSEHPFITRVEGTKGDSNSNGYYWVRFLRGSEENQRHLAQKSFTDLQHGGKENALEHAIEWRDKTREKLGITHMRKGHAMGKEFASRSDTGIVGVNYYIEKKPLVDGGVSYAFSYRAIWRQWIDGKRKNRGKQFSFDVTDPESEKKALAKAKAHRKKMVKLHYGVNAQNGMSSSLNGAGAC